MLPATTAPLKGGCAALAGFEAERGLTYRREDCAVVGTTQADNIWFTCLTMNTNPIHFNAEYAKETEFKRPLVNSCFTLALVTGQSVIDLTMNAVANLGWDEVRLPNPLFEGDTVYAKSEVLETRESKSRPNAGLVRVKTTGTNQHGAPVIEFTRTFMIWKRGKVPTRRGL